MRLPGAAAAVAHPLLGDALRTHAEDGGEEAVHAAREPRAGDHCAPVGLEPAAGVVHRHPGRARDEPVRDARGEHAREERLLALAPPPAHHVPLGSEPREQAGDVGRIVLPVSVERDHQRAARVREAGRERRGLAEIAVQIDDPQMLVPGAQRAQAGQRPVPAAVVHEDELVEPSELACDARQLAVERLDVALLVVDRNDDGERERRLGLAHRRSKNCTTPSATRSTSSSVRSACTGSESISRAACSARGSGGVSP